MIFVVVVVELAADLDDETFKQIMRIFSSYDFRYSYFEIATRFRWQIDLAVVVVLVVVVWRFGCWWCQNVVVGKCHNFGCQGTICNFEIFFLVAFRGMIQHKNTELMEL